MGKYNKRNPTIDEIPYKVGDLAIFNQEVGIIVQVKKVARKIGGADWAYYEYKLRKTSSKVPEFVYIDHFTLDNFYSINGKRPKGPPTL